MNIDLKCKNCGKTFSVEFKFRNKKFCDRKCYFEYAKLNKLIGKKKDNSIREERKCLECGSTFVVRKKVKKSLCSDECRKKWGKRPENKQERINKSKESLYKKYGTESLFNNDEFQKKCRENFKKNMTEFGIVD